MPATNSSIADVSAFPVRISRLATIDAASKYAVLSVAGQQTLLGRPLAYVPMLTWTILYAFEWQVLLYWGIVAGYHAMSASRALERRQVQAARLEAHLVEARLESLQ